MRKRVVTAGRQILAKDVNDISDFLIEDMNSLCKDVFAISTGIVEGFTQSNSLLTATITAGKTHFNDTGTFFELLAPVPLVLVANSTNYIYAVRNASPELDLPVTGFKLIDTLTRAEAYDTVTTRSYDKISISINQTGIAPADSYPLWELITNATVVTSIVDARVFCTSLNITAYSLQHFAQTALNTITIGTGLSQRMTLELYNSSVADYIGLDIAMVTGFAGIGFNFDLSDNVDSVGGIITTENNLGLNIINTGNTSKGIRIESPSILTTTIGLDIEKQKKAINLYDNTSNIDIKLENSQEGIKISENSALRTGIVGLNIVNVTQSIIVNNSNVRSSGVLISLEGSGNNANASNFSNTFFGTGIAQAITLNSDVAESSVGLTLSNSSVAGSTTNGIVIGYNNLEDFTTGLNIGNCVTGIKLTEVNQSIDIDNTSTARTQALLDINGVGGVSNPSLIGLTQNGKGYAQTTVLNSQVLIDVAYGNYITNTGLANSAVGIDIDGTTGLLNAFHTGILMAGVTRGIEITLDSASPNFGSKVTGNGIAGADGYVSTATRYGLDVGDSAIGARLVNNDIGISITNNINDTGISIDNDHKGIEITNSATSIHYGLKVTGSGVSGSDGIIVTATRYGLDIGLSDTGIRLQDNETGILIEDSVNYGINATQTALSVGTIGVSLLNYETGFNTNGCKVALSSISVGGASTIGAFLDSFEKGIVIQDPDLTGIEINNAGLFGVGVNNSVLGFASDGCSVGFSATGYTLAFMNADILTGTAPTGHATGDMFLYYDSGTTTHSIVLYTGSGYEQLDFV